MKAKDNGTTLIHATQLTLDAILLIPLHSRLEPSTFSNILDSHLSQLPKSLTPVCPLLHNDPHRHCFTHRHCCRPSPND
eukprot:scaffold3283_cov103-Alexandrium_tamarense.AAC.33